MSEKIPFTSFGNNGPTIVFAHANGFPPDCYEPLLNKLSTNYKIWAMHQRPLWKNSNPDKFKSWHVLADDLIQFLEENNLKNIIGMGHSMGGVANIIAATKRPDLFSHIVLMDPVLFLGKFNFAFNLTPIFLRKKIIPIAKIALKRKDRWANKKTAYDSLRSKKIFSLISDEYFPAFIDGLIKENKDGSVSLISPKKWEAQIYCTPPSSWKYLAKLKTPTLAIKAAGTNLLYPSVWDKWKQTQPSADFRIIENSSHLVPLERPEEAAKLVNEFIGV